MAIAATYRSAFTPIRELRYHVVEWGPADAPVVIGLHGWMDCAATYQFLVDALAMPIRFVAPDWRGHGRSQWGPDGIYHYTDYLADLDFVLDLYSPGRPAVILGHSLGGNIASVYAGVRPDRVKALVNVDGFGLWSGDPQRAAGYMRGWLAELHKETSRRVYPSPDEMIERLADVSTRVSAERARFIVGEWAEPATGGGWRMRADPRLRRRPPSMFRQDEAVAVAAGIAAAVLWIESSESGHRYRLGLDQKLVDGRRDAIPELTRVQIPETGHMIHWDQPAALAAACRGFLEDHLGEQGGPAR